MIKAGGTITPLRPTRWTVQTAALGSVIDDYVSIMDMMQEFHETTREEYGLKAGGVLTALENFSTLFGLKLGHLLFGAAEEISKAFQAKDTTVQEAVSSVTSLTSFLKRQRTDRSIDSFYASVEILASQLHVNSPVLPRYRQQPKRLDDGDRPLHFDSPKSMYHQV